MLSLKKVSIKMLKWDGEGGFEGTEKIAQAVKCMVM